MKLLSSDLHWDCIVSKYLDVRDMARFEAAIDNHGHRISLSLPMPRAASPVPVIHESENDEETSRLVNDLNVTMSSSSYANISLKYSSDYMTVITSAEMLQWCNNRRLALRRVHMNLSTKPSSSINHDSENLSPNRMTKSNLLDSMDESISEAMLITKNIQPFSCESSFNLLRFVEEFKLTAPIDKSAIELIQQCDRITSFSCDQPITKKLLMILTNQLTSNESRPLDASSSMESWRREHLELNLLLIGQEGIEYLIKHLSSVKSFDFHQAKLVNDHVMNLIGEQWKEIEAVSIRNSGLSDKGLAELTHAKRIKSLTLINCPDISASGFTKILKHFADNLAELTISLLDVSKDDLT
jgi:hypothetical protein